MKRVFDRESSPWRMGIGRALRCSLLREGHLIPAQSSASRPMVCYNASRMEHSALNTLTCSLIHALAPTDRRVFSRAEAASYLGTSVGFFDKLVLDGTIPPALPFPGVKRWDKAALDDALDRMSGLSPSLNAPAETAYDAWSRARG